MCHSAVALVSKAFNDVDDAAVLLETKNIIAMFIQTMDVGSSSTFSRV